MTFDLGGDEVWSYPVYRFESEWGLHPDNAALVAGTNGGVDGGHGRTAELRRHQALPRGRMERCSNTFWKATRATRAGQWTA